MKKFIVISVLMAFAMRSYALYDFYAVCSTGQTLYYQITDPDRYEVAVVAPGYPAWTGYAKPTGDVVVPEQVTNQGILYTVVSINGDAFCECPELTSIEIPNSVTDIGVMAFFQDTVLESVVLPNGLTALAGWTFLGCHSLTSVNIPDSLTTIGDLAFCECSSLTSIILPNTLETIGEAAFSDCSGLSGELVLPASLQSMGEYCFGDCSGLTGVVIPESLSIIKTGSFFGCSNLSGELVIPDQCTLIGSEAFSGCSSLSSLTIGSSVTTIGHSAFMNCTGLEAIHCNTLTLPYTPPIQTNPYYPGEDQHVVFYNDPCDIPVYVNCLAINQFQNSPNWNQFTDMQGVFIGVPALTVNVNNPEFGIAEVVSIPTDCEDVMATVRAIPNNGHVFGYWKKNGVVVSFQPEYTFAIKKNSNLVAYFDCTITVYDSIGYPNQVIGRKFNSSNIVTVEYVSNFSYNQNGVLDHFYYDFADEFHSTSFTFYEFPSKPTMISSRIGSSRNALGEKLTLPPPVTTELITFTYEDDHQVRHCDHYKGNDYYDLINNHYDYYYSDHKVFLKESSSTENGTTSVWKQNRYSYDNGNRTIIDSTFAGTTRLSSVTINQYDDAHKVLTSQTTNFYTTGAISSQTMKTYTYTVNNKTDSIVTQTLNENEWVNSEIAHYVYDFKNRVVEYQTGSWSAENSEWNITKKVLYDFDDEAQKVTISFKKKAGNEWVWDVFTGQSLFNDSQLYEYQRQLSSYSPYQVNQFEISMHYNTLEQSFPILSEWYYEIIGDGGNITYQHLEYMADTVIGSDRPKIIVRTNQIYDEKGHIEVTHEYIKEHEGKVYWWNKELQEFTVLYDYAAEAEDEWEIKVGSEDILVHVDSVGIFDYQGDARKVLHISDDDNVFNGDIVVGYGHMTSFFPEKLMNSSADFSVDGLRCYWVADALIFHQGDEDCDAVYSVIHEVPESLTTPFTIYPNPTRGTLTIGSSSFPLPNSEIRIVNILGQTLLSGVLNNHETHQDTTEQTIDVSSLPSGIYFLSIGPNTQKFVIQ